MAYICSDIKKKKNSFLIGVITIFLVVGFLTALKSLVDVVPIAMIRISQTNSGLIDISIRASDVVYEQGDLNYYKWM